jgi:hypothetical protein
VLPACRVQEHGERRAGEPLDRAASAEAAGVTCARARDVLDELVRAGHGLDWTKRRPRAPVAQLVLQGLLNQAPSFAVLLGIFDFAEVNL